MLGEAQDGANRRRHPAVTGNEEELDAFDPGHPGSIPLASRWGGAWRSQGTRQWASAKLEATVTAVGSDDGARPWSGDAREREGGGMDGVSETWTALWGLSLVSTWLGASTRWPGAAARSTAAFVLLQQEEDDRSCVRSAR